MINLLCTMIWLIHFSCLRSQRQSWPTKCSFIRDYIIITVTDLIIGQRMQIIGGKCPFLTIMGFQRTICARPFQITTQDCIQQCDHVGLVHVVTGFVQNHELRLPGLLMCAVGHLCGFVLGVTHDLCKFSANHVRLAHDDNVHPLFSKNWAANHI